MFLQFVHKENARAHGVGDAQRLPHVGFGLADQTPHQGTDVKQQGGPTSLVAESFGGRGEVSATARRHGLSGGQLFTWRRLARDEIEAPALANSAKPERDHDAPAGSARASKGPGLIVIELGNGCRVRVDRDFDADALGRVLNILDRRR